MLKVNEIYKSIQGESTYAGLPCTFIRLTYCNLRCTYCDTEYAFYDGKDMSEDEVMSTVRELGCKLVEVTGGEPLVQSECLPFMKRLCDEGYTALIETGGSLPIENIDPRVNIIMDLKCPSSGMMYKNRYQNLNFLKPTDELKFVIGDREDYEWVKKIINEYKLDQKCRILFSCVFGKISPDELVSLLLKDNLNVRFQLQMHKYIWAPEMKGV